MARHFFFYGTLRHDLALGQAAGLLAALDLVGPASVGGSLHARFDPNGTYPLLQRNRAGRVHGLLYRAARHFDARSLARLDHYEGVAGKRGEYVRRRVPAQRSDGARIMAEAYIYNRPLSPGLAHIRSGDFADWLSRTGYSPFAE